MKDLTQKHLEAIETFEKYLDKMGYSWNDFDRASEMENLIEQYADERVKQALSIPASVEREKDISRLEGMIEECGYTARKIKLEKQLEELKKEK